MALSLQYAKPRIYTKVPVRQLYHQLEFLRLSEMRMKMETILASAAVRSKAMVLLLFIHCLLLPQMIVGA